MYFLALLILSSKWRRGGMSYAARQAVMLVSLAGAGLCGHVWALPSMANTATTFLVLWLMEKELEVEWKSAAMPVLFANFGVLYFIAHYLHTHPEHAVSLFDAKGLYL